MSYLNDFILFHQIADVNLVIQPDTYGFQKMTFVCYSTTKQMKIIAFCIALFVSKTELSLFMSSLRFNMGNLEMVYTDFICL